MRLLLISRLFSFGMALLWASTLVAGPPQRAISVDEGFANPDSAPVSTPAVPAAEKESSESTSIPAIRFSVYRSPEPRLDDWFESETISEEEPSYLDAMIFDMESDGDLQFVGNGPRIPNVGGFSGQRIGQGNNGFSGQRFSSFNNGFSGQRIGQGNNFFSGQRIGQGSNSFSGQRIGQGNNGFSGQRFSSYNNGFSGQRIGQGNNFFSGQRIGQGNNLFSGQRYSSNRYRGGLYVPRYNGWGNLLLRAFSQRGYYRSSSGLYGYRCR